MANEIHVIWDPLLEFPGLEERQTLSRNGRCREMYERKHKALWEEYKETSMFWCRVSQVKRAGILNSNNN